MKNKNTANKYNSVEGCTKLDKIKNGNIRKALNIYSTNIK
jgi:hypothetical protein